MAFFSYAGVPMEIVQTLEYSTEPVCTGDSADYLFTHGRLHVRCIWSPGATTVPLTSGLGQATRLGVTLATLRDTLMQPRQALLYSVGDDPVVVLPAMAAGLGAGGAENLGARCDAWNGPQPASCTVTEVHGDYSAIVEFAVDFWTSRYDTLVLANRWRMGHSLNEDYFTTITYHGAASFRCDLIQASGASGDAFRAELLPPIPSGFQRRAVRVELSEDGRDLYYEVADEQLYLNLGISAPITRLEGYITVGGESSIKGLGDAAGVVTHSLTGARDGFRAGAQAFGPAGAALGATLGATGPLIRAALVVPKASAIIRVWGNPQALQVNLVNFAMSVAFNRLDPLQSKFLRPASIYSTIAVHEPYAEVRVEAVTGVQAIAKASWDMRAVGTLAALDTPIDAGAGQALTYQVGQNPPPPGDGVGRGTYLRLLVSQLLGLPGLPPAPYPPM